MSNNNEFDEDEDQPISKYQPPKNVPISEIWNKDADDAALTKYKQQLIGGAINVIIEPSDPRKLLLKKLSLLPDDYSEIVFNLDGINSNQGYLDSYKDQVIKLKEGVSYRIKLQFYVQRDIVSGLKFVQSAYKGPIRSNTPLDLFLSSRILFKVEYLKADKSSYMLGSRAPKAELQEYISEKEVAPSGMMARGKYHMKSSIVDDDKNVYAKWEWILEIVKDWK